MRLAAQSKGGYYPTPDRGGRHDRGADRHALRPPQLQPGDAAHPRPCCGGGDAVAQLAEELSHRGNLPVETYGVELHRDRAQQAEERLDRALGADLFATSIANGAFGLAYVNPPYDWDQEDKRVEHAFLTHCTRYLAEGGLLVFIVPRQRLAVSARYLVHPLPEPALLGLPDPNARCSTRLSSSAIARPTPSPTHPPRRR